jgi:hypothetical protein
MLPHYNLKRAAIKKLNKIISEAVIWAEEEEK